MIAPASVIAVVVMAEITGGATGLLTVKETAEDVVDRAFESVATAVKLCVPLVVVVESQDREYDGPAPVTLAPMFDPSS
jgi:hypothetical protein